MLTDEGLNSTSRRVVGWSMSEWIGEPDVPALAECGTLDVLSDLKDRDSFLKRPRPAQASSDDGALFISAVSAAMRGQTTKANGQEALIEKPAH